jgi:hypothetical protein
MTLEDMLDEYEKEFKTFVDDLQEKVNNGQCDDKEIESIVSTQNELLKYLYDAVTYAHESDYPSHFSSEIKKVQKIIQEFKDEQSS